MREAAADIAAVFHWPLSDLHALTGDELAFWQERALIRFKAMNGLKP